MKRKANQSPPTSPIPGHWPQAYGNTQGQYGIQDATTASQSQQPAWKRLRSYQTSVNANLFREKLDNELGPAPKFPFSIWSDIDLNHSVRRTAESVVPVELQASSQPRLITDIPEFDLTEAARAHLTTNAPSLFSSWTVSWQRVSQMVEKFLRLVSDCNGRSISISAIDVGLLSKSNAVLHTSFFHGLDSTIPYEPDHFLAYGAITGKALSTANLSEIIGNGGLSGISTGPWPHFPRFDDALESAQAFGQCFGKDFVVPVAAALLSAPNDRIRSKWSMGGCTSRSKVLKTLKDYEVPRRWWTDTTIAAGIGQRLDGLSDVERFHFLLTELAEQRFGPVSKPVRRRTAVPAPLSLRRTVLVSLAEAALPTDDSTGFYRPTLSGSTPLNTPTSAESIATGDDDDHVILPEDKSKNPTIPVPKLLHLITPAVCAWSIWRLYCLNTETRITPLAFYKGVAKPGKTIWALTRQRLFDMVEAHLRGGKSPMTELSSWASSLCVAQSFAEGWHAGSDARFISIVDTSLLGYANFMAHVPDLRRALDWHPGFYHDYLCHGIIEGAALSTVNINAITPKLPVSISTTNFYSSAARLTSTGDRYLPITDAEIAAAIVVGRKYGPNFTLPFAIAMLCTKQRDECYWRCGNIDGLDRIALAFKDYRIPQDWCRDLAILTQTVFTANKNTTKKTFPEVGQMINLLEALLDYRHGRGARGRARGQELPQDETIEMPDAGDSRIVPMARYVIMDRGVGRPEDVAML